MKKPRPAMHTVSGLLLTLLMIMGYSCDKTDDAIYPEAIIIRELPKLSGIGNHTESVIINSQDELDAVFNTIALQREESLQDIDFSKFSLLLGYGTYGNEVSSMDHSFIKIKKNTYLYLIKVGGDATRPDTFRYGIIVSKLPMAANVEFKLEELQVPR